MGQLETAMAWLHYYAIFAFQCNVQQLFRVRPKVMGKPKIRDIWGISDLKGEKDFNDDHRKENTDFLQSILGYQDCDENVETRGWHAMQKTADFKC
ncbi:uncharacterized protein TNCV_671951 [Trichonephila clavipes]|nr:uncharacterized protein TNCV_671951 [Trichonephila clavipes]